MRALLNSASLAAAVFACACAETPALRPVEPIATRPASASASAPSVAPAPAPAPEPTTTGPTSAPPKHAQGHVEEREGKCFFFETFDCPPNKSCQYPKPIEVACPKP